MPPASEVQQANPPHLANNAFLVNLAVSFNVKSIPLALFILILICIGCIALVVVIILIVKSCIRRSFLPKRKKRPYRTVYLDEVPGAVDDQQNKQLGNLEYSLDYNLDKQQLKIDVIRATNLSPRPGVDTVDPYTSVTVYRDDGEKKVRIGKVCKTNRRQSHDPNWHQVFAFDVPEPDLRHLILVFEVFDYDSLGQDCSLGQLKVLLRDLDEGEYAGKVLEQCGWLQASEPIIEGIGDLCVGLGYFPHFSRIDVTIFEAKRLAFGDKLSSTKENRLLVEVELKLKWKKTLGTGATKSKTEVFSPYYNERMTFPVKQVNLEDCTVICRLRRHATFGTKKTLGYVILGNLSPVTTGVKQWEEMLKSPSKTHVMWHTVIRRLPEKQ